jgi:cysteine desulfurase
VGFSVDDVDAATLMMALDSRGFRLAAGSMCSGQPGDPSPVLEQIGSPGVSGFRVSLGPGTTDAEIDEFLSALPPLVAELRQVQQVSADALARFRPPGTA